MKILRVLYVVAFALLAPTKASADWLPPQVEQAVIQQLADRLTEAGFAWDSEQQRMEGAARAISGMRKYIEQLGVAELLAMAPDFNQLSLPVANQRYLDAMARYHICNMVLYMQHAQRAERDESTRLTAAVGLSAVGLIVIYFRQPYVTGGGDPDMIEAFLTSGEMEPVAQSIIQNQHGLRQHAAAQCEPFVLPFLEFLSEE